MKKLALVLLMALSVMLLALPASAADVALSATQDASLTGNGGWGFASPTAEITAVEGGLQIYNPNDEAEIRVVWAYPGTVQANLPYFNYTLEGTLSRMLFSKNLTMADAQTIDLGAEYLAAGTHSINTNEIGTDLPDPISYYFIAIEVSAGQTVVLKGAIAAEAVDTTGGDTTGGDTTGGDTTGGDTTGGDTNTDTGVELPLALVSFTALAAAGVLVFSRKK
ncbi:MAG: hypothetical protein IKI50_00815 [Clostridia bacterium]|nr:hypothetical protein [Clostridia bacterium]